MAVEIAVLSGARRNERIVLDCRAFQVGCDPNCDVRFDPQRDPAAIGRTAKFHLQEGGWCVRSAGGEMWIGTQRIAGLTHVRSGDVIRMSPSGPEFSFAIVAASNASPAKMPDNPTVAVPASGTGAATGVAPTGPETQGSISAAPANLSADLPTNRPATASGTAVAKTNDRQWLKWVAAAAAGIIVLVIVRPVLFPPPSVVVNLNTPGKETDKPPAKNHQDASEDEGKQIAASKEKLPPTPDRTGGSPPPPDPAAALVAKIAPTVFLITTEKANHYWPHATCVAVGKDTLLTTAFDAMDLVKMRDKQSFKIWVTRPAEKLNSGADSVEFDFKAEVTDIRVLAAYAVLSEKPESTEPLFVNIGLLTVRGTLPKSAALASAGELDAIKVGLRVHCCGFTQDRNMMTSYDVFTPQMADGSVRIIESARKNLPGAPKLLDIRGEISENANGSPVVNDEGKVLGLYSEAVPKEKGLKNFHYVTMVTPEQIDLWLRDRNNASIWVSATAAAAASTTEKQP